MSAAKIRKNRGHVIPLRINDNEKAFLDQFCKQQNIRVSTFLRSCAIDYAVKMMEDKEVMADIHPQDPSVARATFHQAFEQFEDSMKATISKLDERMLIMEKLMDLLMYVFLYHTPAVSQNNAMVAEASALERRKHIKASFLSKFMEFGFEQV